MFSTVYSLHTHAAARYRGSLDPSAAGGAQDYLRVWLMNITNVEDIRQGAKPVLEQVGPFTYRKFKMKIHTWYVCKQRAAMSELSNIMVCK